MSMLRPLAAFASPAVLRPLQTAAVASGTLPCPAAAIPQLSASRGSRPHARRLPPPQSAYSGHPPTAPTTRLLPRPRRLQAAEFLVRRRSNKPFLPRVSAAEPRLPRSPHAVDPDQRTETKGPMVPGMRSWGRAIDVVSSSSPATHLSLLVLFCLIRNPGFEGMMKGLGTCFRRPPKLTFAIIFGASVISVVYDLAVGGKDLQDISVYLRTFEKPEIVSADEQHD